MYRQYTQPARADYDTDAEYQEAQDAFDQEVMMREEYLVQRRVERQMMNL